MSTRAPVPFIVGVGRSGTTLLRLMLDAHPAVAIPAETHFIPHVAGLEERAEDALRAQVVASITGFETWPDFALSREALAAELAAVTPFTIAEGVRAFYRLYARQHGKSRWGDKTPPYCLHLPTIAALLPEAHFIHLIRDGRDVAVSVRPLWFAPGQDVADLARDWSTRVRTARAAGANSPHYLEIRFEDLVHDARTVLRTVCDFLVLPYDPAMEGYAATAEIRLREVATRRRPDGSVVITREERLAMHRLTSTPPDASRIGRWRNVLRPDERDRFAAEAGDLLSELGYRV